MIQSLLYDEIKFDKNVDLEDILNIPDDSDIGFFTEIDLKYPGEIQEKTEVFPFCPESESSPQGTFSVYMIEMKPKNYTESEKLFFDQTDKKKYFIHYKMLKIFVRHGKKIYELHELLSIEQGKWLQKFMSYTEQKRNETPMILKRTSKI